MIKNETDSAKIRLAKAKKEEAKIVNLYNKMFSKA
jgi:hypothetical protein